MCPASNSTLTVVKKNMHTVIKKKSTSNCALSSALVFNNKANLDFLIASASKGHLPLQIQRNQFDQKRW